MKKKVFSIQYSVFSSVKRGALSRAELSREASAAVLPLPGGEGRPARHSAFDEGRGEGELFPNCIVPADGERKFNSQLTKSESMSNVSPPSAFGLLSDFGLRISAFLRHSSLLRRSAFSLIEILVAVALMSFIVLGLLITFNHVSRVFRSGMGQVDFMASGRTVTENIMRELEQMTPSSAPYTINFLADQPRITPSPSFFTQPLIQALPGTTSQRVNSIQELFFFTKFNQDWLATGYKVLPNPGSDCVGSLYRYTATNRFNLPSLTTSFLAAQKTNLSLVADGIVNFRITAFATNGFRILPNPGLPAKTNAVFLALQDPTQPPFGPYAINSTTAYWSGSVLDQVDYYFISNAVPAYVELELGILEPATLQRYRSIGSAAAARDYLSNHIAQVHLFRQRATIRNVDFSAYVSQ